MWVKSPLAERANPPGPLEAAIFIEAELST